MIAAALFITQHWEQGKFLSKGKLMYLMNTIQQLKG